MFVTLYNISGEFGLTLLKYLLTLFYVTFLIYFEVEEVRHDNLLVCFG